MRSRRSTAWPGVSCWLSAGRYLRYHGRMDEPDITVEVEACVPFARDRGQPEDLPAGVEVLPAATLQLASTLLRGSYAVYPDVLDGYDGVAGWITRHDFDFAGPYEIFRDWNGRIGHPGNVLEVGFPIRSEADPGGDEGAAG